VARQKVKPISKISIFGLIIAIAIGILVGVSALTINVWKGELSQTGSPIENSTTSISQYVVTTSVSASSAPTTIHQPFNLSVAFSSCGAQTPGSNVLCTIPMVAHPACVPSPGYVCFQINPLFGGIPAGFYLKVIANVSNGKPPYTYNYILVNQCNNSVIDSSLHQNVNSSVDYTLFAEDPLHACDFFVNVSVVDGLNAKVNESVNMSV